MQLMVPAESAHDTIAGLGEVGLLQFKDLASDKSAFQRTYASQVKRCDEMSRKLRFFTEQVSKTGMTTSLRLGSETAFEFDQLEARLDELESELMQVNANSERLQKSHSELLELQLVLERAGSFFTDAQSRASTSTLRSGGNDGISTMDAPLLNAEAPPSEPKTVRLGFVAGVIQQDKLMPFERLLFRATRGNMFLKNVPVGAVVDPGTAEKVEKAVFVVFFAGERARTKILKICEAFGANRYPFPEEGTRQRQMNAEVTARLRELQTTIEAGERHRESVLQSIAANLEGWTREVKRETAVYHTLNKLSMDVTRKVLVAEAWVPTNAKARVQEALQSAAQRSSASVETIFQPLVTYEQPPTYFQTNKYTVCFQEIVDSYGIARYREANPAVFTIVTFPFLFAVMFGDFGHGMFMLLFAGYLVLAENKLGKMQLNEIIDMMFAGRYCILLMSFFSIYTGLLYNEAFSIPMTIFGKSRWACPTDPKNQDRAAFHFNNDLCPEAFSEGLQMTTTHPYPLGIDPAWHGTRTELTYLNSVKMKLSIILGVAQMNLGIILSLTNQRFFRDSLSTLCEFIPQMIFLNALFGYLSLLIIAKWVNGSTADLYHIMIYMFLSPGNVDCSGGCPENVMYTGQGPIQVLLLLVALIAVPCMLLPKPLILRKRFLKRQAETNDYNRVSPRDDGDEENDNQALRMGGSSHDHHEEEFDFGEVMVHQMIHTIEFVLGAVSNTASYLRLWALSLAHSQLSAVFYDRVIMAGTSANSIGALFIGYSASLGEFQNKFYHGDGYKFAPFSFAAVDKEEL
ncbi:hypothetical protein WJX84_005113 [Apatococcus fuscideae]|uniref:V-type proton ATPase subunit a n=1 Tax=Apatococcus fuscideae TaxID=2026836 RepID=A0AAW1SZK6_9CHLO